MRWILILGAASAVAAGAAAYATTSQRLERLNAAETALSVDQGVNMHRLSRLLSVLEQLKRDPPPALVVSPDDAKSAVRAAILVKALTPELEARARGYAEDAGEVMRQRRLAAVQSAALFEADSLAAEALPEVSDNAGLALRGRVSGDAVNLTPPTRLVMPAEGPVVRRFGDPTPGGGRANGLTLAAQPGARANSPAAGLVQYVGPVKGWDVIVILRLAGGYHLVLAGLQGTSVQVGQSVAEGQPVGWAPEDRQSTPEIYLEVREQGSPVDPMKWMRKRAG
ncbi:MAG: peptidoglycan DD-metalloendopeptidase family protein [Phenylobacterium sp.]|nr:peptidoglycan DD-metalloendopeptidase family protein [Phenylobacterium sp.]